MSAQKFAKIVVTVEQTYIVPMANDTQTVINGWTPQEVAKSWFEDFGINDSHATRDSYRLGGGDIITGYRILPEAE
jgi:hypothetical protein